MIYHVGSNISLSPFTVIVHQHEQQTVEVKVGDGNSLDRLLKALVLLDDVEWVCALKRRKVRRKRRFR